MLTRPAGDLACVAQPGDIGAGRRVLMEELLDPGGDRTRQCLLVTGAVQLLRFVGVGDETGFHQDRRNVRRLQHHEPGLLHPALVQRRDAAHVRQYLLSHVEAGRQRGRHRQVQQHAGEHLVLVVQADVAGTADQVGLVLRIGQPARRFGRGAALGQGIDGGAECRRAWRGVGMNRDEQIGASLARDLGALAQRNEVIAGAHQLGAEALLGVDLALQLLGDGQGHVLFVLTLDRRQGARVFAAMTGIDDDDIVRIRIDGVLQTIMTPPISSLSGLVTRIKILSNLNIAERRLPQDGRFTIKSSKREIDVRVAVLPTVYGEKTVLRLLDKSGFGFSLKGLGFEDKMYPIFRRVIAQPYGMVVVSGPTGSGKSTSLYASLKEIKNEATNITTVEDPVEYQMDGINQVQVHESIGLTFASSLRSILRQDPDILLIGEIRDEETADIAVKFSLTGHLVFSTVHANDAASTITRLLDIGVKPFLVGSCLNLVMAQRLVRTICENCKEEYSPTNEELDRINLEKSRLNGKNLFQGKGCSQCRNTGYHGRTGIFELIPMSRAIRGLVFDNTNEDVIRQKALEEGMVNLRESGIEKVLNGVTTISEVLRSTVEDI